MAASLSEIKSALQQLSPAELTGITLRLARYKKENKELLDYLLFQAHDEDAYVDSVKAEALVMFGEINQTNAYYVKKSLRKILRTLNKRIKYSGIKQTEIELLLFFCREIKEHDINVTRHTVLNNLYTGQLKKIEKAIASLHEDLQYDYNRELEKLEL